MSCFVLLWVHFHSPLFLNGCKHTLPSSIQPFKTLGYKCCVWGWVCLCVYIHTLTYTYAFHSETSRVWRNYVFTPLQPTYPQGSQPHYLGTTLIQAHTRIKLFVLLPLPRNDLLDAKSLQLLIFLNKSWGQASRKKMWTILYFGLPSKSVTILLTLYRK